MSEFKPVDPFRPEMLILPRNKRGPGPGETRFYYYYHRPSGKMIVRYGSQEHIVDGIETIGIDTWTVMHKRPPLKYLIAGYARGMLVDDGRIFLW